MTDPDLLAKKLALIETHVHELRTLCHPDQIPRDLLERRFAEHTLQLAIQGALDVASCIVSDRRLGEPSTHRDLFRSLTDAGWLSEELGGHLEDAAGFRNVLVLGYTTVDPAIVQDVVENHLDVLLQFVSAVRARTNDD